MSDTLNNLGSIWYHPDSLEVPYFPTSFLVWTFFPRFLQQTGSSEKSTLFGTFITLTLTLPSITYFEVKWYKTKTMGVKRLAIVDVYLLFSHYPIVPILSAQFSLV